MTKEDCTRGIDALSRINDLLIRLAGNNQQAERIISDTDLERAYNLACSFVEPLSVIDALNSITVLRIDLESELEDMAYKER